MRTLLLHNAPDAEPVHINIDEPMPTFTSIHERVTAFDAQAKSLAHHLRNSLPQGVYERLATEIVMSMTTNYQTKREVG